MVTEPETGGRRTPWMRGLLIASLALNILILGLAAGWMIRHGVPHGARVSQMEMAGPLTRALSEADRREIGRQIRQVIRENGGNRQEMRASFDALVRDLRAVPFDPEQMTATLSAQRRGFQERFEIAQQVLIAHLAGMSDAERAAYADRVEARIAAYRAGHGHPPRE